MPLHKCLLVRLTSADTEILDRRCIFQRMDREKLIPLRSRFSWRAYGERYNTMINEKIKIGTL
jgi:hypothetical protein